MVIQLSGYLSLRNNVLTFLIDPTNRNHDRVPSDFSNEDRSRLKKIIDEIDRLHELLSDVYHDPESIIGEHVLLAEGAKKILERSADREKSGQLFGQIHQILRKYALIESMFRDIYCKFGKSFFRIKHYAR